MALINCPECNIQISNKASNCPYCGFPLSLLNSEDDCTHANESYVLELENAKRLINRSLK